MTPTALIVDDEPNLRALFAKLLQQRGYQVHESTSGKAAIELVQNLSFDVVIADQRLPPGPTGTEILARHKHVSPKGIRVLFTGFDSDELRDRCVEIDALYVQKPVLVTELIEQIGLMIKKS
jgi:CheY-like chemotaxis protein